jgi:transposase-like protein
MIKGRNYITRYSKAFKLKVLSEIESGHLTQSEAVRKYGISHRSVVNHWIKRSGKRHLLRKVVRIEMPNEIKQSDIIKRLEAEKRELESALANTQIKLIAMESLVEVAERKYNINLKKKNGAKQQRFHTKKSNTRE